MWLNAEVLRVTQCCFGCVLQHVGFEFEIKLKILKQPSGTAQMQGTCNQVLTKYGYFISKYINLSNYIFSPKMGELCIKRAGIRIRTPYQLTWM